MTQKQIAKQYSFLNGKQVNVYIGRVPCIYKHIEKELSLYEKENCFGKYESITIEIRKTHFNGKILTIIPKHCSCDGRLKDFKIERKDIDNLLVQLHSSYKMEHFFYNDTFCSDLKDLVNLFGIDEYNINELTDDWQIKVELSDLEVIFDINADNLCQLLADANEDRLSEDFDEEAKVLKALKESIDFEKLKDALPKLYYPNNQFKIITKSDLVKYLLTFKNIFL